MRRGLRHPVLAATLLAMWALLQQSLAPGALLVGAAIAAAGSWALGALDPPKASFRRPRAALRLAWAVAVEVVRSNNAVARIILGGEARNRRSGFVRIPLDTRNPYCLAALGCIITATPGTLWVEYSSVDNSILLHVLDLIDEDDWAGIIKGRYETVLMEIFE